VDAANYAWNCRTTTWGVVGPWGVDADHSVARPLISVRQA